MLIGIEADRDLLLAQNGMNLKKIDIFTPAEIDYQIWKTIAP